MALLGEVAIAVDQLFNTLLGGWSDKTLSSRVYRNRDKSWWWRIWYFLINRLFFWQNNHCRGAFNSEVTRKHLPKEFRNGYS